MRELTDIDGNVDKEYMKMDLDIIGRYLRGEASLKERIQVMKWAEESESDREEFMALRRIYDVSLMDEDAGAVPVGRRPGRGIRLLKTVVSMVAAASLAVGVTYLLMVDNGADVEDLVVRSFIAPEGHRTEAVLSDGTEVCLNSGSRLDILSSGTGERRVRLDGEAYLDVAHNEDRPFILETSEMEVKVLGTSFDVCAYGDVHSVVLVEGSVEAGSLGGTEKTRIEPDQMYIYDVADGRSRVERVDAESLTTWKDGYLNVRNMTAEELFTILERYYGVEIDCNGISDVRFTMSGKLILETRIDSVLDNLTSLMQMTYSMTDNGHVTVSLISGIRQ